MLQQVRFHLTLVQAANCTKDHIGIEENYEYSSGAKNVLLGSPQQLSQEGLVDNKNSEKSSDLTKVNSKEESPENCEVEGSSSVEDEKRTEEEKNSDSSNQAIQTSKLFFFNFITLLVLAF